MMKTFLKITLLLLFPFFVIAQDIKPDSLRKILQYATTDMARYNASVNLYFFFLEANRDSALFYADNRLALARKNKIALAEAAVLLSKAYQSNAFGRYSDAFQYLTQALQIVEDSKTVEVDGWNVTQYPIKGVNKQIVLSTIHHVFGAVLRNTANYEESIIQTKKAVQIAVRINHPDRQMTGNMNLGSTYLKLGQLDSALYYAKAAQKFSNNPLAKGYIGNNLLTIGDIFLAKGDVVAAKKTFYEGLSAAYKQNNQADVANLNHSMFRVYLKEGNKDSIMYYGLKNVQIIKSVVGVGYRDISIGDGYQDLSLAYKFNNKYDSAYKYQGLALVTKDSLNQIRIRNIADFQKLSLGEALRLENLEKEKIQTQSKIRTYGFLAGLGVLSVIGFLLYHNIRKEKKAKAVIQKTLTDLRSTQTQLIQSEKMASLGELTAGIAHEIQNPLNFVNNFSEVSKELLDEMKTELDNGHTKDAKELADDVIVNLDKISHHGKRASDIVKGMLEHSRKSTGEKEATDINALCDEYLRLAFHGLKAKDNNFNATMETHFYPNLPKIDIIPQDIGRVILNLINNAFYAVNERNKNGEAGYQPTVSINTQLTANNQLLITIKDNGPGIPEHIKDKIFQPFFTTKPTGQGTGLGLSLSYDIVKAHGGELKVETIEGAGSTFIIQMLLA
jgi:two-component system, NtrC family, sensor kinase